MVLGQVELQDSSLPAHAVDHLTYINYAHNRRRSPDISPKRWEAIYGPTTEMEERFQAESEDTLTK